MELHELIMLSGRFCAWEEKEEIVEKLMREMK